MSLAMLTLYVRMGNRRFTPQWWIETAGDWTGFNDVQLFRYWWKETACFVLLMVIPIILMKIFAGWSLQDLGLRLRGTKKEFGLILVLWLAFLPVLWVVSDFPEFAKTYPKYGHLKRWPSSLPIMCTTLFTGWGGSFIFVVCCCLVLRVIMVRGSAAFHFPFVVMHYGKPPLEMMAAIFAGFILCGIALRSRSILPGVVLHWLVQMSMDFANCTWWR